MPTTDAVESLKALAFVAAIWVGCAVGVWALLGAIAHASKIEKLTIELNNEETEK